jgi:hypothetical protein
MIQHLDAIENAQAKYFAIVDTGNRAEVQAASQAVKAAKAALSAALVVGADPCPSCGGVPHGMLQPRPQDVTLVEIGCLACRYHRANGGSPEWAREKWNAGCAAYKGITAEVTDDGQLAAVHGVPKTWIQPRLT